MHARMRAHAAAARAREMHCRQLRSSPGLCVPINGQRGARLQALPGALGVVNKERRVLQQQLPHGSHDGIRRLLVGLLLRVMPGCAWAGGSAGHRGCPCYCLRHARRLL